MVAYLGLIWIGVLALDVFALLGLLRAEATIPRRLIWAATVLVLPVLGFVAWVFAGPRSA